jgi:hypothetical protein
VASKKQLKAQLAEAREALSTAGQNRVLAELREALETEQRKTRVQQVEVDALSALAARNLLRVKAETAVSARTIAESEGKPK